MESFDVIVVGAGPAGTNTATKTAESGLKTIVFEEHQEVGVPVQCGEGISQQLLEYHNIDYKNNDFVDVQFSNQKFYFGGIENGNLEHAKISNAWRKFCTFSG
ncbi:MAG: Digeranylgeranylglycerophospholipid reductase [Candidatus Heimdallarchaeota archaeon LC_3]|nr:MAG: Digeranylgeranylglycerophospholipid reductase [Candidatus Heimdallarchaeota archaeon LC_3]